MSMCGIGLLQWCLLHVGGAFPGWASAPLIRHKAPKELSMEQVYPTSMVLLRAQQRSMPHPLPLHRPIPEVSQGSCPEFTLNCLCQRQGSWEWKQVGKGPVSRQHCQKCYRSNTDIPRDRQLTLLTVGPTSSTPTSVNGSSRSDTEANGIHKNSWMAHRIKLHGYKELRFSCNGNLGF